MELQDTIELMKSSDFKDRFRAEYYQLEIRLKKLRDMIEKYELGTLPFKPNCPIELLAAQAQLMEAYLNVLKERADIEGVEL